MGKVAAFVYGLIVYALFFVTFLYAMGFVGNVVVPKSIDSGGGAFSIPALVIDALLLGLFAVQHSVMARQWFKKGWTKVVPRAVERSTYVLLASLCLLLLYWQWRPMTGVLWEVQNPFGHRLLQGLYWIGWLGVLAGTFMVNHADLFGLRQVYLHLSGKEYKPIGFKTPMLYKHVRHPIYLSFLGLVWLTPVMTLDRALLVGVWTAYIFIGSWLKDRRLVHYTGDRYRHYQALVAGYPFLPFGPLGKIPLPTMPDQDSRAA